jgi:hypothetical protein
MNTYRSLTDALIAGRNNYRGTTAPEAMMAFNNNNNYSVIFTEKASDSTALPFQAGMMGFWGASAASAYRSNDYARNVIVAAQMTRYDGMMI